MFFFKTNFLKHCFREIFSKKPKRNNFFCVLKNFFANGVVGLVLLPARKPCRGPPESPSRAGIGSRAGGGRLRRGLQAPGARERRRGGAGRHRQGRGGEPRAPVHEGHAGRAAVRVQQHGGADPQLPRRGVRDEERVGLRGAPERHQGVQQLAHDPAGVHRRRVRWRVRHPEADALRRGAGKGAQARRAVTSRRSRSSSTV